MSNYAALIDVLSVAGSRLSDGSPNASGTVWFFTPGTNTPVNAYSDAAATTIVTQPLTLTDGGLLNSADFPNGIYVTQPVRLLVQGVDGQTVVDTTYIPATAGDVGVSNPGFTDSTLDGVLTKALTSFGGTDWKYKESGGATSRTVKAKFAEISISVKDFGAVGDGVAIDTTAVQNAINRVVALGGGIVFFPTGTYLIDQGLTVSAVTGLRMVGTGRATIIQLSHATANAFTFTTPTTCGVERMRITHSSTTTGAVIAISAATDFYVDRVVSTTGYAYGLDASGSSNWYVDNTSLRGTTRTIRSNTSGSGRSSTLTRSIFGAGATAAIEINGNQGDYYITNNQIAGTTGILINSAYTGTGIVIVGNTFSSTTSLDMTGLATIPNVRQWGNIGMEGSATSSAVGSSQTPSLVLGNEVILSATSGGAGTVTVNAPASLPPTTTVGADLYWNFVFKNGSGGAVTWTLNAVFVTASAIPTTDAHTIGVRFRWDRTTSKLREVSRADTVT